MRFGKRRGMPLAVLTAILLGFGAGSAVLADGLGFGHTLPRVVPAYDFSTGGEYFAPPIPYGHYAKDHLGQAAKGLGMVHGHFRGLFDKATGLLHHRTGDACGHGGCGAGGCGTDGTHHGGCGHGGAANCGFCLGKGLFHRGSGCGDGGLGGTSGLANGGGFFKHQKKHFAPCRSDSAIASSQAAPAAQAVVAPSVQNHCGTPGCGLQGIHSHLAGAVGKIRCRLCGGGGCNACGGQGIGDPCGGCGGRGIGCGKCGGGGLLQGCGLCKGAGCGSCLKGLSSHLHRIAGSLTGLLHHPKYDWFVGPGGPVPLTPGYVPYIVTTRSPRDYFAFPPMNPNDP